MGTSDHPWPGKEKSGKDNGLMVGTILWDKLTFSPMDRPPLSVGVEQLSWKQKLNM